jgi:hypothetical protein
MNFWTPWSYLPKPRLDDNWDYKAILCKHGAVIDFEEDMFIFERGNLSIRKEPLVTLNWNHKSVCIGRMGFDGALRAAALYIELYNRGISASLCEKLMRGYFNLTN